MLNFLPAPLIGLLASLLLALNVLFWVPVLLLFAVIRLILPFKTVRLWIDPVLVAIAETWISGNSGWMALTQRTAWDVEGIAGLDPHNWYLVNSNHQTWADIFVLQHLFNRRIPLLKFFIKQQLKWVPIMGLAWWALDFPFMRRHSEDYLKKHPEMRGKDQAATRRACEKFALIPTSVMNFLEGTRFTPAKHDQQRSPYRHLLKPKAGGLAFTLAAMGERLTAMVDVTIVYRDGAKTFWQYLCGQVDSVVVDVRTRPIPLEFCRGDYESDAAFRKRVQDWVGTIWAEKDDRIDALLAAP